MQPLRPPSSPPPLPPKPSAGASAAPAQGKPKTKEAAEFVQIMGSWCDAMSKQTPVSLAASVNKQSFKNALVVTVGNEEQSRVVKGWFLSIREEMQTQLPANSSAIPSIATLLAYNKTEEHEKEIHQIVPHLKAVSNEMIDDVNNDNTKSRQQHQRKAADYQQQANLLECALKNLLPPSHRPQPSEPKEEHLAWLMSHVVYMSLELALTHNQNLADAHKSKAQGSSSILPSLIQRAHLASGGASASSSSTSTAPASPKKPVPPPKPIRPSTSIDDEDTTRTGTSASSSSASSGYSTSPSIVTISGHKPLVRSGGVIKKGMQLPKGLVSLSSLTPPPQKFPPGSQVPSSPISTPLAGGAAKPTPPPVAPKPKLGHTITGGIPTAAGASSSSSPQVIYTAVMPVPTQSPSATALSLAATAPTLYADIVGTADEETAPNAPPRTTSLAATAAKTGKAPLKLPPKPPK